MLPFAVDGRCSLGRGHDDARRQRVVLGVGVVAQHARSWHIEGDVLGVWCIHRPWQQADRDWCDGDRDQAPAVSWRCRHSPVAERVRRGLAAVVHVGEAARAEQGQRSVRGGVVMMAVHCDFEVSASVSFANRLFASVVVSVPPSAPLVVRVRDRCQIRTNGDVHREPG